MCPGVGATGVPEGLVLGAAGCLRPGPQAWFVSPVGRVMQLIIVDSFGLYDAFVSSLTLERFRVKTTGLTREKAIFSAASSVKN